VKAGAESDALYIHHMRECIERIFESCRCPGWRRQRTGADGKAESRQEAAGRLPPPAAAVEDRA
jgi:hypothetical protein